MSITPIENSSRMISDFVNEAKESSEVERRSEIRFPFFHLALVYLDGHCHRAYSRNISESGIGLMHCLELPLRDVEIAIPTESDDVLTLFRAKVQRCEPWGRELYTSRLVYI